MKLGFRRLIELGINFGERDVGLHVHEAVLDDFPGGLHNGSIAVAGLQTGQPKLTKVD